jgi:NADPH:quinone reductase-like Zn-dependent oxidoreductase
MKHRRVVVTRHGGPDVLRVMEEDLPEPKPGEVRVKVEAAGVSAYDVMVRSSRIMPPKPPFTPGVDIAGVVDKIGKGVDGFESGQPVAALLGFGNGGYAEYICVPAKELVPVPPGLDPAEVVCLVANYLTAHRVLYEDAKVQRGEQILVQGAAGGVGSAILQLGRLEELEIYGTASKRNQELVSSLGATPIDYKNESVVNRVRELSEGGVDAAFDHIGGFRQLRRSYRCLSKGGRLVWYGVAASKYYGIRIIPLSIATMLLLKLIPDGRAAIFSSDPDDYAQRVLPKLLDLLAQEQLEPIIAERIPLAEAKRAHESIERGGYAGKYVLVTDG